MKKLALILSFIFMGFALSACSDKFYEMKKSPCSCLDENVTNNQEVQFNA